MALSPVPNLRTDRLPPNSVESEMALLGSMMLDPRVIPEVVSIVKDSSAFYDERHGLIYQACLAIHEKNDGGDLVQLVALLEARGILKDTGGADYLVRLAEGVPIASNAPHYAKIVADKARARRFIDACTSAAHAVYNAAEYDEAIQAHLDRINAAGQAQSAAPTITIADASMRMLEAIEKGEAGIIPTGIAAYDREMLGLDRGGVICLFGYPGGCKTTFALTAGLGMARYGLPVKVFSYEQPAIRIAGTLMSSESGVNAHGLLSGSDKITEPVSAQLAEAYGRFVGIPFEIVEQNMAAPEIYSECRAAHAKHGEGVVIVDYLQNLPPFGAFQEATPRIGESMRILQRLARDLGWTVLVLSQLDKAGAKENRRPTLSSGLGSSAIEQCADQILYVWRPHQQEPGITADDPQCWRMRQKRLEVGIVKKKYGPLGAVELAFDGSCMRFRAPTTEEVNAWR